MPLPRRARERRATAGSVELSVREVDPTVGCVHSHLSQRGTPGNMAVRLRRLACTSTPQAHARMCRSFHVVIIEVVLEICGGQVGERTCAPLRAELWAGGARRAA